MDKDALQLLLAQGVSVEQIGRRFSRHPSTVSYWMRKHGLEAPNRAKHAGKGGLDRDELADLVARRMTIRQIAGELDRSTATVRHWLRRYGLSTVATQRARDTRTGRAHGESSLVRECARHGRTAFVIEGRGYYRCKLCRSEQVMQHRRSLKELLVAEAGGACALCGYDRHLGALQFHHLDPRSKRLHISQNGITLSLNAIREEVRKCVLLCSNCHAEVEGGVASVPDTVSAGIDPTV
jgi:transposase-like protein